MEKQLGALRTQACVIRTSVEALFNAAAHPAPVRWDEALHQFNTLTRQLDELRDEVVALPLLGYFVLAPGAALPDGDAVADLPLVLSTRELPAMEAAQRDRAATAPPADFATVEAHNALVDDVVARLAPRDPRRPRKRRRGDGDGDGAAAPPSAGARATAWPPFL